MEVKLIDGYYYTGRLVTIDGLMNIVLEKVTERFKGKQTDELKEAFIRGNHVCYIQGVS